MATDMADLIPRAPGLVAAIIQAEHPASMQALPDLIDLLNDWLADNPELRRTFAIWMRALILRQSRNALVLPKVNDLKELKMTLAGPFDIWAQEFRRKGMQEGREEGRRQGMQQGIAKGEALVLQRLLTKRFGPLPPEAIQLISTASAEQVDVWVERLLEADTLDKVLRP